MVIRTVLNVGPSHANTVECVGHIHTGIFKLLHQNLGSKDIKAKVVLDACRRRTRREVLAEHDIGGGGGVGDGRGRERADVKPSDEELKRVGVILGHGEPVLDRLLEPRVERCPEKVRDTREEVFVQPPLDFARAYENGHHAVGEQSEGDDESMSRLLDGTICCP